MGYSPWGHKESDTTESLHSHTGCFQFGVILSKAALTLLSKFLYVNINCDFSGINA